MTDQNRTAETEQARDLVDTFQLEWDASYPGMHFKCVPSVTRLVRMGEYIARAVDETLAEFDLNRGEAEVLFASSAIRISILRPRSFRPAFW